MDPRQRARKHIVKQHLVHKQHDCYVAFPVVYILRQQHGLFIAERSLQINSSGAPTPYNRRVFAFLAAVM